MSGCTSKISPHARYDSTQIPVAPVSERILLNPQVLHYSTQTGRPDGRLVHPAYGSRPQEFADPTPSARVPLDTVYSAKSLDAYTVRRYPNYQEINTGDILYYTSPDQSIPFFAPNYTTPTRVANYTYTDPMGNVRLQHTREAVPVTHFGTAIGWGMCPPTPGAPQPPGKGPDSNCLSWINDSGEHRQDLMSRQQRPRLEENWQMASSEVVRQLPPAEHRQVAPVLHNFRL